MPNPDTWEERGGRVVRALMREFVLLDFQAAGIVGNIGFESAGFTAHHEFGQSEGVGGYGWAQWTGPRRRAFFAWCAGQQLDPMSDEANYGYLCEELRTTHKSTVIALRRCISLADAVFSVGQTFERPGGTTATHLPGYDGRLSYARRALDGADDLTAVAEASKPADTAPVPPASMTAVSVKTLQSLLMAVGCDPGPIDGIWGRRSQAALDMFQRRA